MIIVAITGLALAGLGLTVVRQQWLYSRELTTEVWLVQVPFERRYDICTPNGLAVEDVFGWVIRRRYLYGSCGRISYFMIDLGDFTVTRFCSTWELSVALEEKGLPRYHMNDEENTSHLIYGPRKYH